ncbi:MAG: hypothetical protein KKG59_06205 [Nanoarchaeota archaeon]|nr:hypothetical protein [Nanoarchaeota archaeon]
MITDNTHDLSKALFEQYTGKFRGEFMWLSALNKVGLANKISVDDYTLNRQGFVIGAYA